MWSVSIEIVVQSCKHGTNFHYIMAKVHQLGEVLEVEGMIHLKGCSVDKQSKVGEVFQQKLVFDNVHQGSVGSTTRFQPLLPLLLGVKWFMTAFVEVPVSWPLVSVGNMVYN